MVEEHRRRPLDERGGQRRAANRVSPRHQNVFATRNDSYASTGVHGGTIPVKSKANDDSKSRRYPKPASNVNTNNRRMTGNVNIYICSETNNSPDKRKLWPRSCTETSSDLTTEQSNSRCISSSSVPSCKLLNSIQEKKRRRLQAGRVTDSVRREKRNDNSDPEEPGDSGKRREHADVKLADENAECRDAASSGPGTRDSCCRRDPNSGADLPLDPAIPRLRFDDPARPWTMIHPSGTRARTVDGDGSAWLNAICVGHMGGNQGGSDVRDNVCRNDVVDGSGWSPRLIYPDCGRKVVAKVAPEEVFLADNCGRQSIGEGPCTWQRTLNRNDIWWRQAGCKRPQEPPVDCREELAARWWSRRCSCITEEEEEDRCASVRRGEQPLSADRRDRVECTGKLSVCRAPASTLIETAIVCETGSFGNDTAGEHCSAERTGTRASTLEDSAECPRRVIVRGGTLENSGPPPKVTGVCKEFVAGEPAKDITVCGTTFGELKGPPEEVAVGDSGLPDPGEAPEETISETSAEPNFAGRDNVGGVSLNDAEDKLARGNTDTANLNSRQLRGKVGNAGNAAAQVDREYNVVVSDNFTRLGSTKRHVTRDGQTEGNGLNSRSGNSIVPVESIGNSKPLSRNVDSTAPVEFRSRSNFISTRNPQEIRKIPPDKRGAARIRLPPRDRPATVRPQQQNKVSTDFTMRDSASSKNNQIDEAIREESTEKEETQDTPGEKEMTEEKPRESIFHRPFKKLIDIIRHYRAQSKDRMEAEKVEAKKAIKDAREDITRVERIIPEALEKTDDAKERDVGEETPIEEIGDTERVVRAEPTAPMAELTIPQADRKTDVPGAEQTHQTRLVPKLLRVMAAKRSRLLAVATATSEQPKPEEPEAVSVPVDIKAVNGHGAREEVLPREKAISLLPAKPQEEAIPPEEPIPLKEVSKKPPIAESTEESTAAEESLAPRITVDVEVEASAKDVLGISERLVDEDVVSQDLTNARLAQPVPCPKKRAVGEPRRLVPCKYDPLLDPPFDYSCPSAKETRVPCPQRKPKEEERDESIVCKRRPHSRLSNDGSELICVCTKRNKTAVARCACKINGLERKQDCRSSGEQSARYLESCWRKDKPNFRDVSPLRATRHVCTNYHRGREECGETPLARCQARENCGCKHVARDDRSIIDRNDRRCASPTGRVYCARSEDQSRQATLGLAVGRATKKKSTGDRRKPMICVYCDNPQDECACRAAMGKCSRCGLSSDVCDCDGEEDLGDGDPRRARIAGDESRIRVTSWRPKREIRRYFARDPADLRSDSTVECRCCGRLKWQRPEELPYQRLNVFSDVMNELQRKMSESVCCARCRGNPCRCGGSRVDRNGRLEGRGAECYVWCPETEKSPAGSKPLRSKSPRSSSPRGKSPMNTNTLSNNCRCNCAGKERARKTVKRSIRRVSCVCGLSPCRCRRGRPSHRRPLAKCYYCKSLPCA